MTELTLDELVELRDTLLDASRYWKEHGNEYAEEKTLLLRDRVNSVIFARYEPKN